MSKPATIAAIYVDSKRGPYAHLPGVDCWDEARDATTYPGPWPVVAHPPCGPWGKLRGQCTKQDPELGPTAVHQVVRWGGVLEHPAGSLLWEHCRLPLPGWFPVHWRGRRVWSIALDQCEWGHEARKATWILLVGVDPEALTPPPMKGAQPTRDEEGVHIMSDHAGPWRDSNASIWKFNLPVGNAYLIPMPARATLLHVGVQGVTPCLWAAVDTRARKVGRRIQIAGTGHDLPLGKYVGTFQLHGGALVFHVFDCGEEELPEACHD